MSVEISTELLLGLCVMLVSWLATIVLHKKLQILQNVHQISLTILLGAAGGFLCEFLVSIRTQ